MDDRRLDELLDDAARTYRAPPEAPLDALWARVEAETFAPVRSRPGPARRWAFAAVLAASLLMGVALGRASVSGAGKSVAAGGGAGATPASRVADNPNQRTTRELLARTAVLLAALPTEARTAGGERRVAVQAAQLLTTTRLLLDSPVASDQRMRSLLQDLELVLAQVARIRETQTAAELLLINDALEERNVVPRIRTVVTEISLSDY